MNKFRYLLQTTASRSVCARTACLVVGLGAGMLISDAAFAQQKIEQMIVTATKRAQDIQQVPASISAFSGQGLQERQIRTIESLTQATPNLNVTNASGNATVLSMRGVTTEGSASHVEGVVALHIDGVYQPRVQTIQQVMNDLDSIEVLRGPQGTVYGRNANAGVVNFITAKPTDTFEGSGTIFGGSYERYGARGYVSGPVAEGVTMRASAMVDRMSGWGTNLTSGNDTYGDNSYGGRLSIRLKPTDDVTVDLMGQYIFDNSSRMVVTGPGDPLQGPGQNYTLLTAQVGAQNTRYTHEFGKAYQSYDPRISNRSILGVGTITWDINPNVSLKSITGYSTDKTRNFYDSDNMTAIYINTRSYDNSYTISQEFNLNAKLWDRLDLIAGLYYLKDEVHGGAITPIPPGNPVGSTVTPGLYLDNTLDQKLESKAIFLDATLNITDDLRFLAGIRRTYDDKDLVQHATNIINVYNFVYPQFGTPLSTACSNLAYPTLKYKSTTGRVGLQYDFTPSITGYVTWQDGFKDGGLNNGLCGNFFQPESVYSWEAGIKTHLFDDSVELNITAFDTRYKGMQISRTINLSPTVVTSVTDNAGSASIRGAEIEGKAYINDNWSTDLAIGILDPKYGTLLTKNGAVFGASAASAPSVNIAGNQLAKAAKLTVALGIENTMRIGDLGELKSRAEWSYQDRVFYTVFNEATAKQDAYSLFNAIFTFTPDACPDLQLQVFGKNLLNKHYFTGVWTSGIMYFTRANWGPPRTFGAELTAKF